MEDWSWCHVVIAWTTIRGWKIPDKSKTTMITAMFYLALPWTQAVFTHPTVSMSVQRTWMSSMMRRRNLPRRRRRMRGLRRRKKEKRKKRWTKNMREKKRRTLFMALWRSALEPRWSSGAVHASYGPICTGPHRKTGHSSWSTMSSPHLRLGLCRTKARGSEPAALLTRGGQDELDAALFDGCITTGGGARRQACWMQHSWLALCVVLAARSSRTRASLLH